MFEKLVLSILAIFYHRGLSIAEVEMGTTNLLSCPLIANPLKAWIISLLANFPGVSVF
jgi:hypothetical protein